AVAAPPADIDDVRLNNRLRGMLAAAMGSLTLMAKDPARRLTAAEAVFKSRDAGAMPLLEKAIAAETDERVKRALNQAHAALVVTSDETTPEAKVAAIAVISARGDQDALSLLRGLPADQPPAVRAAAAEAIED